MKEELRSQKGHTAAADAKREDCRDKAQSKRGSLFLPRMVHGGFVFPLIRAQKIRLNPTESHQFETFFYAKINEERDRRGRCAGRLAPHFRGKLCSARRQTPRAGRTRSSFKRRNV